MAEGGMREKGELRAAIIRLAHSRPEMRPHLLPLLTAKTVHRPHDDLVIDLRISLETARGFTERLRAGHGPAAHAVAGEIRQHIDHALQKVNGELVEAVQPSIVEQVSGWFRG